MFKNKYKTFLIITLSIVGLIAIPILIVKAATYYRANHGATTTIAERSRQVINNSSYDYFVPNNTDTEWNAFNNKCTAGGLPNVSCTTNFVCGTSTVQDADGNSYNTVLVNNKCWMASNLKVGTMLASGGTLPTNNGIIEKWCYNNSAANCTSYGGLYGWNEAMQYSTTPGVQGVCPTGWHIPTDPEMYALENYLKDSGQTCDPNRDTAYDCSSAGTKLKSGGSSGMNFPLAGIRGWDSSFDDLGTYAFIWSSSASGSSAWFRLLYSGPTVYRATYDQASYGMTIRCLKST